MNKLCELADFSSTEFRNLPVHRKHWEYRQLIRGLESLPENSFVLAVGAGHEPPVYELTNRVRWVFATDIYGTGDFGVDAHSAMLIDPDAFAYGQPYNRRRLRVEWMNALDLRFEDNTFDAVFSLSAIEHFGGLQAAGRALSEMIRVAKPNGIIAITTECLVHPDAAQISGPGLELFSHASMRRLLAADRLRLVEPLNFSVSPETVATARDLDEMVRLGHQGIFPTPHIVVRDCAGNLFTSISVFGRKSS